MIKRYVVALLVIGTSLSGDHIWAEMYLLCIHIIYIYGDTPGYTMRYSMFGG